MSRRSPHDLELLARSIVERLVAAGFVAYYAGGCVRDMLLEREAKDYDIATSATPDDIVALFDKTVPVGKAFGVVNVVLENHPIEVATFRKDLGYEDGRHPTRVEFGTPEEDARRRDFTINSLFYDPRRDQILDYVGGRRDIAARLVRAVGEPQRRFQEDRLRMLRAVRLASTLEFTLDPETASAIRELAPGLADLAAERIQQELTRLLTEAPRAGEGLRRLLDLGLLEHILPEVADMAGQQQPAAFHPEGDVFTHTTIMLDRMENASPQLAYAVLLHDVGKPGTAAERTTPHGDTCIRFDRHAQQGAAIAERILRRLKLPARDIGVVTHCIANHMRFIDVPRMRQSTLRRLVGAPTFPIELELHRLDCIASHGNLDNYHFLLDFQKQMADEPVLPPRWVTGKDIMALGIREGPEVGRWLREAYDAQMEGRFADRDELLDWIRDSLAKQKRG